MRSNISFCSIRSRRIWSPLKFISFIVLYIFITLFTWKHIDIKHPLPENNSEDSFDSELVRKVMNKIDSAKRDFLSDNITDGFNLALFDSLSDKEKNKYVSNLISVKRRLKDVRQPECKAQNFTESTLPTVSIVVIFCNEHLSFILRTIWSILSHTPRRLLHEIILVDDASNTTEIKVVLPWYLKTRFQNENIRLVRNSVQMHLIGSKNIGAKQAVGETLIFLEGHMEVTPGWIEPMLQHISLNKKSVSLPMLDFIDYKTLDFNERVNKILVFVL